MERKVFKPGDKVKVKPEICERNPDFCVVSPNITQREDDNVPLGGKACGCVRAPEKIIFLAPENQTDLSNQG